MSGTTPFYALRDEDIIQALTQLIVPRLQDIITDRAAGHCMRIADLDLDLMLSIARVLRREFSDAQIHVLSNDSNSEGEFFITSTKLVELRNPLPDGTQRPPLLIFLPANLHTNAEDSFNVASFEEISVTDVYDELVRTLLERIPVMFQGYLKELLLHLMKEKWSWADLAWQGRFLLTAIKNGIDGESLGAALFEIGLIPDFQLFTEPSLVVSRIRKNLDAVRYLTNSDQSIRGRVLALELIDKTVQRHLTQFLIETGVEDPRRWTRRIVLERPHWDISFDKWKFKEENPPEKVFVQVLQTDLHTVQEDATDEKLQNLVGQQVLLPKNRRSFKIEFATEPHPQQIQGLSYFTVQIISQDGTAIGVAKKVKAWKSKGNAKSVTIDKINSYDFEEGWHFLRVLPWTEEGDTLPLVESSESVAGERARPFESELFYVLPDGTMEEEPPQRAVPQAVSLEHARLRLQFTALTQGRRTQEIQVRDVIWTDKSNKGASVMQPSLEIKFGREGAFKIPVAAVLQDFENRILRTPERLQSWRLRIGMGKVGALTGQLLDLPKSAAVESFLAARAHYCAMVRSGDRELITQASDLRVLTEACAEYAEAYHDLLSDFRAKIERAGGADQQRLASALRAVLSIDTVHVSVADFRGRSREAVIISPTHPLRALWFNLWAQVARHWLALTADSSAEYVGAVRDSILEKITPINFPVGLPLSDGRIFLAVDHIHPFWSLYTPAQEDDARGLLGEICAALGLSEPSIGGAAVTGEVLASRLDRYLLQHPYVRTLIINAFNPGRAMVLAEALLWLQKKEATANLRYNIRLFVPETESPSVGESLEQLLSPTSSTGAEADAFSVPSGNHLFPKLNLAIHSLTDFKELPEAYQAHITMLFDLFPAEELGVGTPLHSNCSAPLHGLIQDFNKSFSDDENGTAWRQQPQHGVPMPLLEAEHLVDLLANLSADFSRATATAALGLPAFERLPIVTLTLDAEQRALLHNIHDISDWVFTIDRHLGIEFFDHGGKRERPPYLVDYVPSATSSSGHQLIITSRSTYELRASLRQSLNQYGIETTDGHATLIINALRSLSGRLALKFMSAHTHQAEALGLALARLFLEQQGALSNQIVLPLDSHLDLFRAIKLQANEIGENWSLQRTDLALFDLNSQTRTIRCNLVEVKFYRQVGGFGEYQKLKESIAGQIKQSEEVLRRHFDPEWKYPDRPDRLLKTREFSTILRFYLERALRYELLDQDAAIEGQSFLATLEDGYNVDFNRSAIIFTLNETGSEMPDIEDDIDFYRVGADVIRVLLNTDEATNGQPNSVEIVNDTIPQFTTASFITPKRPRSALLEAQENQSNVVSRPLREDGPSLPAININEEENIARLQSHSSSEEETGQIKVEEDKPIENETPAWSTSVLTPRDIVSKPISHPEYSVMLGTQVHTPQYGIIGEVAGRKVALDLNQTHTISLFGVQGGGKSYTLGSIVEMACIPIEQINVLPSPLATVIFHYSPTQDYRPEFTSMVRPNTEADQVTALRERYGAEAQAIQDIVLLCPASKMAERKVEYPDLTVLPISFAASELKAAHWKFLMGAVGSQSMYLRQVNLIMRKLRESLTLERLVQAIEESQLSEHLKGLARTRLQFAAEYIDDDRPRLTDIIRPGRLIIVDLRDEFIDKDEALGLFVVLLQIFSEAAIEEQTFNKLVVFDEAHKYIESPDLVAGLVEVVREMRHRGTSIIIASQDPPSVPVALIELSSQIILHKFNSPAWLKHMQKANAALSDLTAEKMSRLGAGEAFVWSSKATDDSFTRGTIKIRCRPRVTQHGGGTKTAIS
jgi:DNA phosphorothioation-dependent restriction protein DptH